MPHAGEWHSGAIPVPHAAAHPLCSLPDAVLYRILLGYPSENLLRHASVVARVHPEWHRLVKAHSPAYAPESEVAARATKLPTGELATSAAERRRVLRACSAGMYWLQNGRRAGELSVFNVRARPCVSSTGGSLTVCILGSATHTGAGC